MTTRKEVFAESTIILLICVVTLVGYRVRKSKFAADGSTSNIDRNYVVKEVVIPDSGVIPKIELSKEAIQKINYAIENHKYFWLGFRDLDEMQSPFYDTGKIELVLNDTAYIDGNFSKPNTIITDDPMSGMRPIWLDENKKINPALGIDTGGMSVGNITTQISDGSALKKVNYSRRSATPFYLGNYNQPIKKASIVITDKALIADGSHSTPAIGRKLQIYVFANDYEPTPVSGHANTYGFHPNDLREIYHAMETNM